MQASPNPDHLPVFVILETTATAVACKDLGELWSAPNLNSPGLEVSLRRATLFAWFVAFVLAVVGCLRWARSGLP